MHLHSIRKQSNKAPVLWLVIICIALCVSACGGKADAGSGFDGHEAGSMELKYATRFSVDYYDDDISVISIGDDQKYLFVPGGELPGWLRSSDTDGMIVITGRPQNIYVASSSVMDLIDAIGGLGSVSMTSTDADDWTLENIRALVEEGDIQYIGKYRAPDLEALVEGDAGLAIENTMIYHKPQIKEAIEELGIPVMVEMSSLEAHPIARLEWIKLYGLLLGKQDEADRFFEESLQKIENMDSILDEAPEVAYFSLNGNGAVTAHKPGDYISKMIEMAGGSYALDGIEPEEENALSTMNIQMETFYEYACDADILIYNSTIQDPLESVDQLLAKSDAFSDFRAVKTGSVWCTNRNIFQKSTGAADIISEMNQIFRGTAKDSKMEYFYKLK